MFRLIELIFDRPIDYYVDDIKEEQIREVLFSLLDELSEREKALLTYHFSLDKSNYHFIDETALRFGDKADTKTSFIKDISKNFSPFLVEMFAVYFKEHIFGDAFKEMMDI